MNKTSAILDKMRSAGKMKDMKAKGDLGEEAVLQLCYQRKEKIGNGLLYQSFKYPYQTNRQNQPYLGNIKYDSSVNKILDFTKDSFEDEIDVLYITPYRIFPIEVKSYRAKLEVNDMWFLYNGGLVEKSPVAQAEKHARHLYHAIYDVLPDGRPEYIVPIVCFVDKCKVKDTRSEYNRTYIPACILNNFLSTINKNNTPLEYNLVLPVIEEKLMSIKTSIKKTL